MVHLLQVVSQTGVLLCSKGHSLFQFPQFLSNVIFLFQDLIQNIKLHLVFLLFF